MKRYLQENGRSMPSIRNSQTCSPDHVFLLSRSHLVKSSAVRAALGLALDRNLFFSIFLKLSPKTAGCNFGCVSGLLRSGRCHM